MTQKWLKGFANLYCICTFVATSGCAPLVPGGDSVPETVPDVTAARFTNPTQVDHPYFPLAPGTLWTYSSETQDGVERIVAEVLHDTREVMGVACRVVRVREYLDEVLIEDTHDWHAQDDAGNVWYMGEEVDNYNYDDAGDLVDVTHEGAWEAGKDVAGLGSIARPGYLMKASPAPGERYHQEYYVGDAEDEAVVVALDVPVTLSDGTNYTCLQTRDFTRLEPDAVEFKYYAPSIGLVLEETADGDQRVELISIAPE